MKQQNLYLWKFAWKSIKRNAGRSIFIIFSVSLAVFIAVWVIALFDGLNIQIEEAVVKANTGYFQVQEKNYSVSTDSSFPKEYNAFEKQFTNLNLKGLSPELVLDGNISTPEGSTGLSVLGIHPPLQKTFLPIDKRIRYGDYLKVDDVNGVIIGYELSKLFNFKVDDQIVLNYQDVNGELRSELLQIRGIYKYNSRSFEKKFVYVNQRTWQKLFLNEDKNKILFNRVCLMTDSLEPELRIKEEFKNSGLIIKTWKDLNPEMAVVLDFHDGMIRFFFIIIGLTIIMTILTPVQMLWQERLKELKMLNILGVSNQHFWKIGFFEVIQMIFSSGLISTSLLVLVIGIQSYTGIDFRFLNEGLSIERAGIKLPRIIYPQLTGTQIIITFCFVFIVLSISYIWSIHSTMKRVGVEK